MNDDSREQASERAIERLCARVSTACHGVYTHFLCLFSCTRVCVCVWPAGSVAAAVSSLLPLARSHHSTGLYTTVVDVVVVVDSHDDCLQHMFTIKRRERKTDGCKYTSARRNRMPTCEQASISIRYFLSFRSSSQDSSHLFSAAVTSFYSLLLPWLGVTSL